MNEIKKPKIFQLLMEEEKAEDRVLDVAPQEEEIDTAVLQPPVVPVLQPPTPPVLEEKPEPEELSKPEPPAPPVASPETDEDPVAKKRKLKKSEDSSRSKDSGLSGFWTDERKLFLAKETCVQKPYIDKNVWSSISRNLMENMCFQGVDREALSAKEVQATFRQLMIDFEKLRERGLIKTQQNSIKKALYDFLERTRTDMLQLLQSGQQPASRTPSESDFSKEQQEMLQRQMSQGTSQEHKHMQSNQQQQQVKDLQQKQMLLMQQHVKNLQNANNMNEHLSALQNYQNMNQQLEQRFQDISASDQQPQGDTAGLNPAIFHQIMAAASAHSSNPQQQQMIAQQLIKQLQTAQQQQLMGVGAGGDARMMEMQRQSLLSQMMRDKEQQQQSEKFDQMQKMASQQKDSSSRKPLEPLEIQQKYNELGQNLGVESDIKAEVLAKLLINYTEKKKAELEELMYLQSHPNLLELAILREQNLKLSLAMQLQKLQQK